MARIQIRKLIHDKLITDFTALKHVNGTDALFAGVKKIFINLPASLPVCEIIPTSVNTSVLGLEFNEKAIGFTAITYEQINQETGTTESDQQTEAERKITRLSDIEDIVIQYLEKIPDSLRGNVGSADIVRIDIQPSSWDYQIGENGLRIFLSITFAIVMVDEPKSL